MWKVYILIDIISAPLSRIAILLSQLMNKYIILISKALANLNVIRPLLIYLTYELKNTVFYIVALLP